MTADLERVARALHAKEWEGQPGPEPFHIGKAYWMDRARAALEPLKKPSEAVLAAGDSMMPQIAPGQDITTGRDALAEAWPAMIDTILKGE